MAFLRAFVAATQQDRNHGAGSNIVDAISWPVVDPHLKKSSAERLCITWIALLESTNASGSPCFCLTVAQVAKPRPEFSVRRTSITPAVVYRRQTRKDLQARPDGG
jgi:hypothetical protein